MRTGVLGVVVAGLPAFLIAAPVRAEPSAVAEAPDPQFARLAVGLSADIGLVVGTRCPAVTSDAVGCPLGSPLGYARLAARWVATPTFTLGLSGGPLRIANFGSPSSTTWWDLQVEARRYPWGQGHDQTWIGAAAGVALAVDHAPPHTIDTGEQHPSHTFTNYAPSASVGAGLDTRVGGGRFALGPELRAILFAFRNGGGQGGAVYGPQFGVLLGLTVTGSGVYR